uniref:valine--tRNA ligase n=1 Tax=Bicosoecida sp. CB-2014 TaxID=1486930 RepID=A0A7S1CA53_9STRA|mmetsp:Transcript_19217/g.67845  ORF Transcript_19217/g.67845 Transcript_19217/m.67845 type:complete len:1110 (+) Transcript_19217:192-3521(+)
MDASQLRAGGALDPRIALVSTDAGEVFSIKSGVSLDPPAAPAAAGNGKAKGGAGGAAAGGAGGDANAEREARKKAKAAAKKAKGEKKKKNFGEPGAKKKKKKEVAAFVFENKTPKGDKKDMTVDMLDAYHPQAVEAAWQDWWEASGFYRGDAEAAAAAGEEGRFVMMIPPPNVTGSLHLGHALTTAIEDCLTRWHRMSGRPCLWLPGTDHAGIATQVVVEKKLKKERNITRHDLGREAFISEVWKWKESYGNRITTQLRHLGASVDWSREAFTMDDNLSVAVKEAFVRLTEEGLIYRDTRLVNWSSTLKTAISDIEVDYIDLEGKTMMSVPGHEHRYEFGTLTSFAYKVDGSDEEIVVATTRLETMLGDTAVAVHPDDPRYTHLHGKMLVHPFNGRKIPIVCDDVLVDMSFGSGAVKITPAHDPNDFACGRRHGLPEITIFTDTGEINENGAPFTGVMRFDARFQIKKQLEEMGLLRGVENNKMRIPICSRSGDVIEPLLKPQWWVNCQSMAKAAADAVRDGSLKIVPAFHEDTWFHWLDNIRDWCISRQLWWGHRVPAYFVTIKGREAEADRNNADCWVAARDEDEARRTAVERFGADAADITLEQDEDVLDTWFSSALFPFSTVGWPDTEHPDFKAFYPGTLLETGHDILFFWVARMVMMGLKLCGELPFKTVYLHAMVRDKYGRKMSKSLGNVIDPMEVIYGCPLDDLLAKLDQGNLPPKEVEKAKKGQSLDFPDGIPECGADAMRFGLLAYTVQGRDVNLDINRVVGYRQFCNKLWNATKFALKNFDAADGYVHDTGLLDIIARLEARRERLPARDSWILSRLAFAVDEVTRALGAYEFGAASTAIYNFWLHELCDVYLELIKPTMYGDDAEAKLDARNVLYVCLDHGLKLLHPMMPFVTEELWHRLPGRGLPMTAGKPDPVSIMVAEYPSAAAWSTWRIEALEAQMEQARELIGAARSLRASAGLAHKTAADVYIRCDDEALIAAIHPFMVDIGTLATANKVTVLEAGADAPDGCAVHVVSASLSVLLMLKGVVDPADEVKKLTKKLKQLDSAIAALAKKMAAKSYASKVPEDVKEANLLKQKELEDQRTQIADAIAGYASWSA